MLTAWHDKVQVQDHQNITSNNTLWSKIIVYKEVHEIYQPESTGSCYIEAGIKFLSLSKSPRSIILHTDSIFQRISLPLDLSSQRATPELSQQPMDMIEIVLNMLMLNERWVHRVGWIRVCLAEDRQLPLVFLGYAIEWDVNCKLIWIHTAGGSWE